LKGSVVPLHSKMHAPPHWLFTQGIYMVTAGTYQKLPHWNTPKRHDFLLEALFARATEFGWQLQAWAVLSNHYHFIAASPEDASSLRKFIAKLHMTTAKQLNEWDGTPGRKVWYQYWDSQITFEQSYLARLNYVHHNPAHHGVTENAFEYRWCSAKWFTENAPAELVASVENYKTDKLVVSDDF
jgi:putative transposase